MDTDTTVEEKADLQTALRTLSCQLFAHLAPPGLTQTVVLSPLSIALALAVAAEGARGETQQALLAGLGLSSLGATEALSAYRQLYAQTRVPAAGADLSLAQSLWTRQGHPVRADFAETLRQHYDAHVEALDFSSPQALQAINTWVQEQTKGEIPRIIDSLPGDAVLCLVNALYVKAPWQTPFDLEMTTDGPFTTGTGQQIILPMMRQAGRFPYYGDVTGEIIRLPFKDNTASMVILLPAPAVGLAPLLEVFSATTWDRWMARMGEHKGTIVLPRFKVTVSTNLVPAISALGMTVACDRGRADFSGMMDRSQIALDQIVHAVSLTVDEVGAVAAAVTGMMLTAFTASAEPFHMVVNRPFICALVDNRTGTILFMGAIVDPPQGTPPPRVEWITAPRERVVFVRSGGAVV